MTVIEFGRRCRECGWPPPCIDACPYFAPCGDPSCLGCFRRPNLSCGTCLAVGGCADDCPEQNA